MKHYVPTLKLEFHITSMSWHFIFASHIWKSENNSVLASCTKTGAELGLPTCCSLPTSLVCQGIPMGKSKQKQNSKVVFFSQYKDISWCIETNKWTVFNTSCGRLLISFWEFDDCSVQFSSFAQLCLTLCNPINHNTPGLLVHHQLMEFTQTHVR